MEKRLIIFVACILTLAFFIPAEATDFSGANFISRDPVIDVYGGNSTSSNFQNIIAGGQIAIGESSSSNFILRAGFLYFTTTTTSTDDGGGGGGGGGGGSGGSIINFSGTAFPSGIVTLLQDAQVVATSTANSLSGQFYLSVGGLAPGNYIFGIYASDLDCRRSSIISYNIDIPSATTVNVTNIFISPTIVVSKSEVSRGRIIAAFGYTAPVADVSLFISGAGYGQVQSQTNGRYFHYLNTAPLSLGEYSAQTRAYMPIGALTSAISLGEDFVVGSQDKFKSTGSICGLCQGKGDLNSDCRVDLVDFSIAAFWWMRPLSPAFQIIEAQRLNGDGIIDLTDFSIMAYYWTG
ncbi:MAG: hypothetical protein AAB847_01540 [Patescibacteria group bacterium]